MSKQQAPTYAAEAELAFSDPAQDLELLGTPVSPSRPPAERAAIGADYVERNAVLQRVARDVDIRDLELLREIVTARPEARTNFVVIEVQVGSAREAATIANAFARAVRDRATAEERTRYDRIADGLRREYREATRNVDPTMRTLFTERVARVQALRDFARPVEIAKTAGVPDAPESPKPIRNTLVALLAGLILGLLIAFGRDALDRRMRDTADAREALGLPLLGQLSHRALGSSPMPLDGHRQLDDRDREAIRIVRTNLEFLQPDADVRVVLVTSAVAEEGKSTTAAALAVAAARSGQRVLLLECDLRQPSMADRLGLRLRPGLTDVLRGDLPAGEVQQALKLAGGAAVACITGGSREEDPPELLASPRFRDLLARVREDFDLVVLDGTPLLSVVDARELVPLADALLLCVRASRTTHDEARAAREALARLPHRPAGLVVTGVRQADEPAYGAYTGPPERVA